MSNQIEFIPKTCQWIDHLECECRLPTVVQTAYCEIHYPMAYQTVTAKDLDSDVEKEINTSSKTTITWKV